jgi:hypothetical protein
MKTVINIQVDDKMVTLDQDALTGEVLKQAVGIPKEVGLVLEIENGPDKDIINEETYKIKSGMEFFSKYYKRKVTIEIDNKEYTLESEDILGSDLMKLANINSSEYKLLKEVRHGADIIIEENTTYHLEKKDVFFSVIKGIQNGNGGTYDGVTS